MPAKQPLPVAATWFRATEIDDSLTRITEPHVDPLLQANIWHVRGRDRDLLVDAGLGVAPLRDAFPELFERDPVLVVTHAHLDHMGGAHEFPEVWAHPLERLQAPAPGTLNGEVLSRTLGLRQKSGGPPLPELLISARPHAEYDLDHYRLRPARVTRELHEGDTVDLGDRSFTVLHLPGHSPGSVALFDQRDGTLFSGDVLYDDELLDTINGADRADYRRTMLRLRDLPVRTVHAGHDGSFHSERMHTLIDAYLTTEPVPEDG